MQNMNKENQYRQLLKNHFLVLFVSRGRKEAMIGQFCKQTILSLINRKLEKVKIL